MKRKKEGEEREGEGEKIEMLKDVKRDEKQGVESC